jgi:hypothetical protein
MFLILVPTFQVGTSERDRVDGGCQKRKSATTYFAARIVEGPLAVDVVQPVLSPTKPQVGIDCIQYSHRTN